MKSDQNKTIPLRMFYALLISILILAAGGVSYFLSKYSVSQPEIIAGPSQTQDPAIEVDNSNIAVYDPEVPKPSATAAPTRNLSAVAPANASAEFIIGNTDAAEVTLIEYIDLNCSHCKDYHTTLKTVTKEYEGRVAWVVRNFPVLGSSKRAAWMECVGAKNGNTAYWQFMDNYFAEVTSTPVAYDDGLFNNWLAEKGYSQLECDQEAMLSKVTAQWTEGLQAGISTTPTIVILTKSGEKDSAMGAMSPTDLRQVINSYLPKPN